jgi:hypothetical protein
VLMSRFRCWAAGAERAHGHEQAMLECDVPSNGTRRRSCGGELLCEMQERDGRLEDAAQVFDEMSIRVVLENVRVLLLSEASRVQDAIGRMLQRRAGRSHAVREVRLCDDSGRTRPGGSRAARRRRRRPLRRKQWTRSGGTVNFSWRVWRWSGASRPWPSRRQRGRVWRGEAKAKVQTDLD